MDYWITKQLRAAVLADLAEFIPEGYWNREVEKFALNESIRGAAHLSFEIRWGFLAGSLGRQLYFESSVSMTPRQVAASEMLMHLGMLAGAVGARDTCSSISRLAEQKRTSDGNASQVGSQLTRSQIPQLESNVRQGLKQYLLHLDAADAAPFQSLLYEPPALKAATLS